MRKFLGTFLFSILLLMGIIIVFDVSEKIDDFLERHAPLNAIVFQYYVNFLPFFISRFTPLFTFISVIFFTSKMAAQNEILSMLGSGISFRRLSYPFVASAAIIAIASYLLNGWVIPPANRERLEFEDAYIRVSYHYEGRNVHRQIKPGEFIFIEYFNSNDNIAYHFSYEKIKNGKLTYKLLSDYAQWDTTRKKWHLQNYFIRKNNGMKEPFRSGAMLDTTIDGFNVEDFTRRDNKIEAMNNGELNKFIKEETLKGSANINTYLIEKYRRASVPFAVIILALMGFAIASRKARGGIGVQLGLGIGLSFTYILFMQISTTFSIKAGFSPFLSVWIPNILFGGVALYLLRIAPK